LKTAWNIIAIVSLLNLLILLGFVGWLVQSQRLDRARLHAVVAMLKPTIPEEAKAQEEERKKEEELRVEQEKIAHLKQAEQGPVTLMDRLSADQQADELAMHKLAKLQTEIAALHRGLETQNRQLTMERQLLVNERQAFEDARAAREKMVQSEDFKQAVALLEQIKPAQAKQMFEQMIRQGGNQQVVEYLAAMDERKSAAMMREFKSPEEIATATWLIEQLRLRRSEASVSATPGSQG